MYTRKRSPRRFPSFFLFYEVVEEKKWLKLVTTAEQKKWQ
jgi:hypothetical protein